MVGPNLIMGKTQRVVVCGAKGSGKTSIIEKVIYNKDGPFPRTLEDVYVANIESDRGIREQLRFYDTAGLDHINKEIHRHLLCAADGFIIVYSVDDEHSYQICQAIKKDIDKNREKKDVIILVLGNKSDRTDSRKVDSTQALNWAAAEKIRLVEVSATDRTSLFEPFSYLASKLNPPPNKSTLAQITSTIKRDKNKESE